MINNACKIPSENVNSHRDEQAVKADFLDPRNEFFLNRWGASLSNNFFRKSSDNTPIPDNRYSFTEGTPKSNSPPTNPDWADNFDAGSFRRDLDQLREKIACSLGPEDIQHLRKIERRGRIASVMGYATIWLIPNPLTAFLLSFGQITRWLLAHQILHRAYDKVPDVPPRYTSKVFAKGWRRFVDWFDWINPEAWHQEHNILHHYYTGEEKDPDLIERNVESIRKASMAKIFKYGTAALTAMTWRFSYYAPNTISTVDPGNLHKRSSLNPSEFLTIRDLLNFKNPHVRKLWATCYLPYGLFHFVLLPLLFLPFGTGVALCVLGNKILAECILNVHSFFVIGSNHTGSDLYRFDYHIQNKEQFYTHQVLGSANYHTGGDTLDHLQIWLNYQIEHHLFPDIPMLKYQEIQPEVKRLCEKHGIPYIQESVFTRTRKMVDVWVGNTHMMEMKKFPSP